MTKQEANWSPYDNNGGSCVAIAGADYCVITADTRYEDVHRLQYPHSRLLQNLPIVSFNVETIIASY
ncbi:hypothetical protein GLYMA_03G134000v4 [Glycine max]|uniref:Uncharacterized protein n=2 Tax=Glycine subgen. Soja TaxID=1462606 RepID=K7KET9_SOYBN|nr:hypothetical protein JHK85_007608 [Glycine max]RZC20491.1 Proteasome subunit beta type-1 isoform A [Glycine soja]KAG5072178.1 hypothetical protein JHK86_007389 [Glycine max]KAH1069826.1 hypothetical protein GYH30_007129 [Glycine max]KAH1258057.1 Proteasome subunit beta type-1 [Glycine max]